MPYLTLGYLLIIKYHIDKSFSLLHEDLQSRCPACMLVEAANGPTWQHARLCTAQHIRSQSNTSSSKKPCLKYSIPTSLYQIMMYTKTQYSSTQQRGRGSSILARPSKWVQVSLQSRLHNRSTAQGTDHRFRDTQAKQIAATNKHVPIHGNDGTGDICSSTVRSRKRGNKIRVYSIACTRSKSPTHHFNVQHST